MIARNFAGMIAIAGLPVARELIAAKVSAEREAVRATLRGSEVGCLEVGQTILINGDTYLISGVGPSLGERLTEEMESRQVLAERSPPAPKFGSDRPYLKKKKGRS